jgi:hypothetical protein
VRYKPEEGAELYKQGYRYILHEEHSESEVLKEKPRCAEGYSAYRLKPDGSRGACVDYNYGGES